MLKNLIFLPLIFLLFLSIKNFDLSGPQESEYYFTRRMPTREEVLVAAFKEETPIAKELLRRESGISPIAVNPSSGACGLGQSLPCSKMNCNLTHDIKDFTCQVFWVRDYVEHRYGDFNNALAFWDEHNWY